MPGDGFRWRRATRSALAAIAIAAIALAAACGRSGRVTRVLETVAPVGLDSIVASVDSGPPPLAIRFAAYVRGGTAPLEYEWRFGDGVRSDSLACVHVYGALGDYDVRFVARDATGDSAAVVRRIRVAAERPSPLSATVQSRPATALAPSDITVFGSGTYGQPPYTYRIEFGDGTEVRRSNSIHRYREPGQYTATMTVVDSRGDTARSSTVIHLLPRVPPVVTVAASPESGLVALTVRFQAAASGGLPPYTYQWNFGSGAVGGSAEDFHTYGLPGTYDASVIAMDAAGQRDTAVARIRVLANELLANARATPARVLQGVPVSFTGSVRRGQSPIAYLWTFGDGETAAVAETTHVYRGPGSYVARFTATDAIGTSTTLSVNVVVGTPLSCTAWASPVAGQAPLTVGFRAEAGGGFDPLRSRWDFGDGSGGLGANVEHRYLQPGEYRAVVTVRDTMSVCSTAVVVTVSPAGPLACVASATPSSGFPPLDVSFRGALIGAELPLEYLWEFGDGTGTRQAAPTHRYELPGSYRVRLSVRDAAGRTAESAADVVVRSLDGVECAPVATPAYGYVPLATRLTSGVRGGSPPYTVDWDFGDGGRAAGETVDHVYAAVGDYTARITARDAAGDTTSGRVTVGVHDPAATALEIVNDLVEEGDWERWNGLVSIRIGPDRAAVESSDPAYERLSAGDAVANLEDAKWILPTYRRQNASNTARYDMTDAGPHYFVRVALGWWDRRCGTPDDCAWVRGRTMTQCCDCAALDCPKAATVEVAEHFAGAVRLKLSDLLPDGHWCRSVRCAQYMKLRFVRAGDAR